jgi:hypothetical protein
VTAPKKRGAQAVAGAGAGSAGTAPRVALRAAKRRHHGENLPGDMGGGGSGDIATSPSRHTNKRIAAEELLCAVCDQLIVLSPTITCSHRADGGVCGAVLHESCASRAGSSRRAPLCKTHLELLMHDGAAHIYDEENK